MPTKSKKQKTAAAKEIKSKTRQSLSGTKAKKGKPESLFGRLRHRIQGLLVRRPHRSFRRSRRRDYARSLKLPGFWAFTNIVRQTLWKHKRIFGLLALVYALLTVVLVGIASQDTYDQLRAVLEDSGGDIFSGNWGEIGKAGMLLWAGVTGSLTNTASESQQIYGAILLLFAWLTTVWLLRAILADRQPRLRDGLYNAGAPVLAMFLVGLVMVVQLLPLALAIIGYSAATTSGLLSGGGVEVMLFWVVAGLLALLSLYWATSTFIALVVVTLPGMYPMQALRTAGDLVIGRRVRILLRLLWMLLLIAIAWVLVVVPVILFDAWLKGVLPAIAWLPIVPIILLIMSTLTVIWSGSYVYLLYRRIVDDDASPA
jgi:hypothetical protein